MSGQRWRQAPSVAGGLQFPVVPKWLAAATAWAWICASVGCLGTVALWDQVPASRFPDDPAPYWLTIDNQEVPPTDDRNLVR